MGERVVKCRPELFLTLFEGSREATQGQDARCWDIRVGVQLLSE